MDSNQGDHGFKPRPDGLEREVYRLMFKAKTHEINSTLVVRIAAITLASDSARTITHLSFSGSETEPE